MIFTFQYGQIYYTTFGGNAGGEAPIYIPIWLDLLLSDEALVNKLRIAFTFQYGQIYYPTLHYRIPNRPSIYIPIWLDLLSKKRKARRRNGNYLHSNMVRFIMALPEIRIPTWHLFTFQYGQIYYQYSVCRLC